MWKNFKAAIFDLDGTLLDSMGIWDQIDVDFLKDRGISLPPDYQKAITPMVPYDAAVYTIERFHFEDTPGQLLQLWEDMAYQQYRDTIPLKEGAYEYVRLLHEKGIRMSIASSSMRIMIDAAIRRTGIADWIERVITTDEVSRGKDFPDIYLKCAEEMGFSPSECIVFEDIEEGLKSAKAGGFRTVGVADPANNAETIRELSDVYVRDFRELLQMENTDERENIV